MEIQFILIPAIFIVVILLNIFIAKYIIKRAVKRFVIPTLENKGLVFKDYKWVSFFQFGDFKDEKVAFRPSLTGGSPYISLYVYIYYMDSDSKNKRITIRIDTLFLFIRKVEYSSEL